MTLNIHEIHTIEDHRLPFIFHTDTVSKTKECSSNWHENIELLCFIEGSGQLHVDGRYIDACQGDVAIINADELHTVTSNSSVIYHCLIIDSDFCSQNGIDVRRIKFTQLVRDGVLFEKFLGLTADIEDQSQPHAITAIRYDILGILLHICQNHSAPRPSTEGNSSYARVKDIVRYLHYNFRDVTLDTIAEHVNMSKFHMSREFKRAMGLTVFEYLNVLKCENARRMLLDGAKAFEAATESGFDNLSYFSRTFKRYMGILPSECKKRN